MSFLRPRLLTPFLFASLVKSPVHTPLRYFSISSNMAQHTPHILIVGGAYGGLSALNTLVALSSGKPLPEGRKGGPPGGRAGPGQAPNGPPPPAFPALPEIPRALLVKPRYTILDERDGFYHTVGAPLGQISASFTNEFWIRYADIDKARFAGEKVEFVQGEATELNAEQKILKYSTPKDGERSIPYDYLIVATGMRRGGPVVPQATEKSSALEQVDGYETSLSKADKIVLVGGGKFPLFIRFSFTTSDKTYIGAVGIEMSAETKLHFPKSEVILIHSRNSLLSAEPLPEEYKAKALDLVHTAGVEVKLGNRVLGEKVVTKDGCSRVELSLSSGESITCDKVIYTATQKGANTQFLPQNAVDEKGCVLARDT
jgi:apoptosis-inducing factor 2